MEPVAVYIVTAFLLNIPFGVYRSRLRKLSAAWFVAIHLPIPLIILTRVLLEVSPWWIPVGFAAAVAGQVLGVRIAPASWRAIGDRLNEEREREKAAAQASKA